MRKAGIVVVLGFLASGCGAASATLHDGVYKDDDTSFTIGKLPASWKRIHARHQTDIAWHDKARAAVIQIDASCDPALDIPLSALTSHLLIGFTDRKIIDESLTDLNGRESLRSHLEARLDGVKRELLLQVLKKDGCVYDFALAASPGEGFKHALTEFDSMVSRFRTATTAR